MGSLHLRFLGFFRFCDDWFICVLTHSGRVEMNAIKVLLSPLYLVVAIVKVLIGLSLLVLTGNGDIANKELGD